MAGSFVPSCKEPLIRNYFTDPKDALGHTVLENNLEKLIALKIIENIDLFICSINTLSSYANYEIGFMFKQGQGVQKNNIRASVFFKKSADQGHADAQYQFALLKLTVSPSEAYAFFLKAATQGHVLAQRACIQTQLSSNSDLEHCLAFSENLADKEDIQAQFWLARLLDTGIAGKTDKSKAYALYNSLAKKGNIWAQYYCARMLEQGVGTEQDIVAAKNLYLGCHQTCFDAKLRLACLLLQDPGDQERVAAAESIGLNVSDLDINGACGLQRSHGQRFFSHTTAANSRLQALTTDQQLAVQLLEHYCDNYVNNNTCIEGELNNKLEMLIRKINPSAFDGSIPAIITPLVEVNYLLGKIYQEAKGVKIDAKQAIKYYQKASHQLPDANYRIGCIHETGLGVDKNWVIAKKFYQKAAERGHVLAGKRLTWSYAWSVSGSPPSDATLQNQNPGKCVIM